MREQAPWLAALKPNDYVVCSLREGFGDWLPRIGRVEKRERGGGASVSFASSGGGRFTMKFDRHGRNGVGYHMVHLEEGTEAALAEARGSYRRRNLLDRVSRLDFKNMSNEKLEAILAAAGSPLFGVTIDDKKHEISCSQDKGVEVLK